MRISRSGRASTMISPTTQRLMACPRTPTRTVVRSQSATDGQMAVPRRGKLTAAGSYSGSRGTMGALLHRHVAICLHALAAALFALRVRLASVTKDASGSKPNREVSRVTPRCNGRTSNSLWRYAWTRPNRYGISAAALVVLRLPPHDTLEALPRRCKLRRGDNGRPMAQSGHLRWSDRCPSSRG